MAKVEYRGEQYELLPCPFCGEDQKLGFLSCAEDQCMEMCDICRECEDVTYQVICSSCGSSSRFAAMPYHAANYWNRRPK